MSERLQQITPEELAAQELQQLSETFPTSGDENRPQIAFEIIDRASIIIDSLTPEELERVVMDNSSQAGQIIARMAHLGFELHCAANFAAISRVE